MPGRIIGPSSLTKQALWGPLSQGYDIAAKADHPVSRNQIRLMLQSLLNERFQLAMRRESKSGPVYKLVVAKGRPKLQPSDGGDLVMARGSDGFEFRNAELLRLASYLSNYVNREVIDDTGIEGSYNFS